MVFAPLRPLLSPIAPLLRRAAAGGGFRRGRKPSVKKVPATLEGRKTKHLNFLAFAKAFLLYDKDSNREYRKSIKPLIIYIISSINFKRNNYNFPITHQINITSSWLFPLPLPPNPPLFTLFPLPSSEGRGRGDKEGEGEGY